VDGPRPGRRICVVGSSGSGKTFVAQALAARLGLRYVSNDALIWRADWVEVPDEERAPAFDAATREDGWTFDGNLGRAPGVHLVLGRCDTLVWLDLPRWQVMWSVTARTLRRMVTRERLWHGNVERWRMLLSRDSMIFYTWRTYGRRKRQYEALFASGAGPPAMVRLRSRREVDRWLASVPRAG